MRDSTSSTEKLLTNQQNQGQNLANALPLRLNGETAWLGIKLFFSIVGASLNGLSAYESEKADNSALAWYFFSGSFIVNIAVNFIFCDDAIHGIRSNKPLSTKFTALFFTALYVTAAIQLSNRVYNILIGFGFPPGAAWTILTISTGYAGFSRLSTNINGHERIKQKILTLKIANPSLSNEELDQRCAVYELMRDLERMKYQISQKRWKMISSTMTTFKEQDGITQEQNAKKLVSLVIGALNQCENYEGAWWRNLLQITYLLLSLSELLVYKYLSDGLLNQYSVLGGWEGYLSTFFAIPSLCFVLSTVTEAIDAPINFYYMRRYALMGDAATDQQTPVSVTLRIGVEMLLAAALLAPSAMSLAGPSVDMHNTLEKSSKLSAKVVYNLAFLGGYLPEKLPGMLDAGTPNTKSIASATLTTTVNTYGYKKQCVNELTKAFYTFNSKAQGDITAHSLLADSQQIEAGSIERPLKSIAEQALDYVKDKSHTNSKSDYSATACCRWFVNKASKDFRNKEQETDLSSRSSDSDSSWSSDSSYS